MGGRFADFDAAFAERDQAAQPVVVRLFGRDWDCGSTLPAAAALRMARLAADRDMADVDLADPSVVGEVMLLAADLVPPDVLAGWQAKGITVDQLGEVVMWVFGEHLAADPGDGDLGEGPAPVRGAPSSSPGGVSSRPTSPGSTGSTSPTRPS